MDGHDVDRAVAEMVSTLDPFADRDWRIRAGTLTWSCWRTAGHVAHDLLAYAGQVAGRPTSAYLPFDLHIRPDTTPGGVLAVVAACGRLLSSALATADPGTRGWHWGPTDPGGFAALGVNETLMHTYDITRGLGVPWLPPADLSAGVIARLFPEPPAGPPARVLLWLTGRGELGGLPRRTTWIARAARG